MSLSPPVHDFLDDDSLAPLKRNHACLQCKKRKVKCDGTKPACAPCMRSHAHALRTAQRNKTSPPVLSCTWADNEGDSDEDSAAGGPQAVLQSNTGARPSGSASGEGRKKSGDPKRAKGSLAGGKTLEREKERRRDEEKDSLLARIAQLEARLEALSSSDRLASQPASSHHADTGQQQSPSGWGDISTDISPVINASKAYSPPLQATVEDISPLIEPTALNPILPNTSEFDFGNLFMVPAHWPYGLPSPFLLEHLVEVFFSHAPQMPRMIHRASFLARLRLPPNNPNFPHASLLHAICAYASTFTAWVNNLPPEQLEAAVERHKAMYNSLDGIEDFGLAQAEAAQRAIRFSTQACEMGDGNQLIEIVQANIMLSDIYFTKGMPMQGWIIAGTPARILKSLEIMNRNKHERHKEPLAPEPKDAIQREERLATIWMAFIMDTGFTLNSYWNGSMELDEVFCNLPISYEKFKETNEYQPVNPQTAHSPDLLVSHPVADSFVLAAKASTLISRVSRWLRDWTQRDIVPGDELLGIRQPSFTALVNDIYVFQASVPGVMKNIFRIADSSPNKAFDANVLLVHVLPHVALCLLHEPFVNWRSPVSHTLAKMQQSYEAIVGLLHLIPSNLDISLITTSLLAFCMYTTGRIIANFVQKSLEAQQYGNAVKHRADMQTVQNILNRYGQKHQLGTMMSRFLDSYLAGIQSGKHDMSTTKCIGESIQETKIARTTNDGVDEAATVAAAQMYYTAPQSFGNSTAPLDRLAQITADQAQRKASGSSAGYCASSSSGITPPMLSSATPPSGITSGSSHQGSATCASISSSSGAPTPDVLDWTTQMDYTAAGQVSSGAQFGTSQQQRQQQQQQQHPPTVNLLGSTSGSEICWQPVLGQPPQGMDAGMHEGMQQMGMGLGMSVQGSGSHPPKMGVRSMDLQEMEMRNFAWTDDGSQIVWAAQ